MFWESNFENVFFWESKCENVFFWGKLKKREKRNLKQVFLKEYFLRKHFWKYIFWESNFETVASERAILKESTEK